MEDGNRTVEGIAEDYAIDISKRDNFIEEEIEIAIGDDVFHNVKKIRKDEVRKPYSKWLLFSMETRPIVVAENPNFSFQETAKCIADRYKNLSSEENDRLDLAVIADKARYTKEMSLAIDVSELDSAELIFPLAKIKRAAKMDPDVKNIGKESLIVITKATELFVALLAAKCGANVALRGARSITEADVINVIHNHETLDFLRLDFPKSAVKNKPLTVRGKQSVKVAAPEQQSILHVLNGDVIGNKHQTENEKNINSVI